MIKVPVNGEPQEHQKISNKSVTTKSEKDDLLFMHSLKKCYFDQSTTEQRASKKSQNMVFDFTLLRSVSKFDRGQSTNENDN